MMRDWQIRDQGPKISRMVSGRACLAKLLCGTALIAVVGAALPASTSGASFLTLVAGGYSQPVFVTHAGDSRLFVVEQGGRIKIVGGGTFLDISSLISAGGERGLLGLAFHPNYANNRLLYVNYTRASDGATVIAEFRRSTSDPNRAVRSSRRTVLVIGQPYANHNGGWLGFKGRYLYIATGDGGSGGDPENRAQSKSTLLGKILRINPRKSGTRPYTVPDSNPFVGRTGRDEIWAYGLRNPWRCSFDRQTKYLWCADVGQGSYEEVNRSKSGKGLNYGWRLLEGKHYFNYPGRPSGALCTSGCKTLPIVEYAHTAHGGSNCSVTGGYVGRRSGASFFGRYIFGDYCSGNIWVIGAGFSRDKSLPAPRFTAPFRISSFGEGNNGRIYVVDHGNGRVYRVNGS